MNGKSINHNEDYFWVGNVCWRFNFSQFNPGYFIYLFVLLYHRVYSYAIEAVYQNGLTSVSNIILDTHEDVSSVQEISPEDNITIYPNPTVDVLQLQSDQAIELVKIYALDGKLVKQVNVNDYQSAISVADLKLEFTLFNFKPKKSIKQR